MVASTSATEARQFLPVVAGETTLLLCFILLLGFHFNLQRRHAQKDRLHLACAFDFVTQLYNPFCGCGHNDLTSGYRIPWMYAALLPFELKWRVELVACID